LDCFAEGGKLAASSVQRKCLSLALIIHIDDAELQGRSYAPRMPNVEHAKLQAAYAACMTDEKRLCELVKSDPRVIAQWLQALARTDDASRRLREHIRELGAMPAQASQERHRSFISLREGNVR
jgi:hypothetical protein